MTQARRAPSFRSDNVDPADRDRLVALLDAQAELPSVRRLRRWALDALAARPGERTLDVGSGTGSEVVALAAAVGADGEAVGVDPNPGMLAVAADRAAAAGSSARFVPGSAYALPFDDGYFDVVRCERVYQHLDHPDQATAEIARVLRPGGRVMLIDSDWATAIVHPGDPNVLESLRALTADASPNRNSGRRLRGLLVDAGFVIDDIGSGAVLFQPDGVIPMYTAFTEAAVAQGVITADQRERLLSDIENGIATGDYHFSVTMFAVLAHRP